MKTEETHTHGIQTDAEFSRPAAEILCAPVEVKGLTGPTSVDVLCNRLRQRSLYWPACAKAKSYGVVGEPEFFVPSGGHLGIAVKLDKDVRSLITVLLLAGSPSDVHRPSVFVALLAIAARVVAFAVDAINRLALWAFAKKPNEFTQDAQASTAFRIGVEVGVGRLIASRTAHQHRFVGSTRIPSSHRREPFARRLRCGQRVMRAETCLALAPL